MRSTHRPFKQKASKRSSNFISYSILVGAGLLYSILNPQYTTGVYNDDAVYVLGARSLWGHPAFQSLILKPDYPLPGLPLLLAPFIKFVEPYWTSLEWLSVAFTVFQVYLLQKWVSRWLSEGETLAVVTLFAFNPLVARMSGILMPTPFYTTAMIASFLLLSQLLDKPSTLGALALGFIAGWGSLVRPEGFLLLFGIGAALVITPQGRSILRVASIPIALWFAVLFYWFRVRHYAGTEYGGDITALASYWSNHLAHGIVFSREFLQVFLIKPLTGLNLAELSMVLFVITTVFCLSMVGAGFRNLWKQPDSCQSELVGAGVFCVLYSLTHLFWHAVVPRYAIPVLPFLFVFLVRGIQELVATLKHRKLWSGMILALVFLSYACRNGSAAYESLWAPDSMKAPPWRTLEWMRRNTPANVKVVSNIAPIIELYADRPVVMGVPTGNIEMHLLELMHRDVKYIVDRKLKFIASDVEGTSNPNQQWDHVRWWFSHYPKRFHRVYDDLGEQTSIYEIHAEPAFEAAYEKYREAAGDYLAGHFDQAFSMLKDLEAGDVPLGSASNLLGVLYWKRNDLKRAESAYLKAIELLPGSPAAMINLATLYNFQGQTERTEDYLRKALEVSALRGEEDTIKTKIQSLRQLWSQHQTTIFMDPP